MDLYEFKGVKVDHPDYKYVIDHGKGGCPVVVFERSHWKEPTAAQLTDYREREKKVKALGGVMLDQYWQIAGRNAAYTIADCQSMRAAVAKALGSHYTIVDTWNGTDCYTYSVSIQPHEPLRGKGFNAGGTLPEHGCRVVGGLDIES